MIAAVSADPLGVLVAFGAGILSFLSPCVLPLVPGYLSMVTGLSAAELTAATSRRTPLAAATAAAAAVPADAAIAAGSSSVATATLTAAPPTAAPASRRLMLRGIGLFVAGFTVVFVALGAVASGIGHVLAEHRIALTRASGILIVVFGVLLIVGVLPSGVWARLGAGPRHLMARLTGEHRFDVRPSTLGIWAAPIMGMAFAFAWTPCIGPVLGAVDSLAAKNGTLAGGVLLLFAYSLGLAVPFVITGLAFGRMTSVLSRVRRWLWVVELVAGGILVTFGVLLLTNNVAWISNEISSFLNTIGLGRLSTS